MKKIFFLLFIVVSLLTKAQVKGYNNPWFFGNFSATNYYPSVSVLNQIKALNPKVLRFPGGNIANGYDVTKPGYGYPKETGDNYIYNQVRLSKDIGAQTAFVANLYTALVDPDNEAYWIQNIVTAVKILNPKYVELGNEIPIYSEITGVNSGNPNLFLTSKAKFISTVTASAGRYVTLCQKVINAVRAAGIYPLFGVTMDQPFHDRGKTWNSTIRNWGGYDGEIFHIYLTTRTVTTTKTSITNIIAGSNKPVWITEWGWVHGNGLFPAQWDPKLGIHVT